MPNEVQTLDVGLNKKTADWLNTQHNEATKSFVLKGIEIGKILYNLQISDDTKFVAWAKDNLKMHISTAYDYISLYKYREQIAGVETVTKAYKLIETFEAQKKQSETAKAYQRVNEYQKTGVKPEGWRRGTDDKLAREEADRDARIEAVKQEALKREKEKQEAEKKREEQKRNWQEEIKQDRAKSEVLHTYLEQSAKELKKRIDFKEKIRLSADGMNDPFQDALIDYLDGLNDDNRRIEACYNIIKICKSIANELQIVHFPQTAV